MSYGQSFHDTQPITWWNRVPVYLTGVLTAALAFGVIVCAILGIGNYPAPFAFSTAAFMDGRIWTPLTYAFADRMSFFTPLGLMCFYVWGVEIEKHIGRQRFSTLFVLLLAAQPLVCVLWSALGVPATQFGNYEIMAAMLIGFAVLYPNVEYLFGWVPLKWFAFVCFIAGSLMLLGQRDWIRLSFLWVECGVAFGYIRWVQHGGEFRLPSVSLPLGGRRPKLRVLPDPAAADEEEDAPMAEVDALLDKIAKSGIGSLSPGERARLEKAREELMKRESPRR
ncbi:MAG: DUF6576 domain-containing protein [Chthoniobacteraceae bacterium]